MTLTALILVSLAVAAASQPLVEPDRQKHHTYNYTQPAYCLLPCPAYAVLKSTPKYEVRVFDQASFAGTIVTLDELSPSVILATALKWIEPYLKGHNLQDERLHTGLPFMIKMYPLLHFHEAKDKKMAGVYLNVGHDFPPTPRDKRVVLKTIPAGTQAFVRVLHQPLTKQTALFEAAVLATALESDGIEYNDSELGIAFYEASPTAITGLYHTEILLKPKVLPEADPAA